MWKQPINTYILSRQEFNAFDRAVWFEILMRCRNQNGELPPFYHGNKLINLYLRRGQMLFRVSQFSMEQGCGRRRVRKSIGRLQKWYNEMDIESKPFGLIISVKNYDEVVKMDNERDNERTMKGQ